MLTSSQVASAFSAQNQMFMGQNAFAQQIGIAPPGAQIGAFGRAPPSQGFNFGGGTGMFDAGYTGGNRAAAGLMSIGGGIASVGTGLALDPFSAFIGGAARYGSLGSMGGIGAGIGGGLMAAAPIAALAALAQHSVSSLVGGGQQQMALNNALGQNFQFFNPQSRTGSGFTRQDSHMISQQIRSLSEVPEMMSSFDELTKMLPKLKSTGLMQGVKDATEFSKRFKDAIKTINDTARILGTTMDDAATFFAQSRGAGFIGKDAVLKNALNVQFTSGMTGMTNGQVMGMQTQGADFATQIGARRSLGATAVTNIAQSLGAAQRQGLITDAQVQDVTGLSGAEGIQALSGHMNQAMVNIANSSAGRAIMAGLVKFDKSGKATGLDTDLVRKFNAGEISIDALKSRGMNLSDAQKISFTSRTRDLAESFAGQVGPGGFSRFMDDLVGNRGSEAVNLMLQRYGGMSSNEADIMQGMQGADTSTDLFSMAKVRARESQIRQNEPSAIFKRIGTRLHKNTFGHLERLGADIQTSVSKAYDDFIDDLVGRHVVTLSKEGAQQFSRAMSGGSNKELMDMFSAAHGIQPQTHAGAGMGMIGAAMLAPPGAGLPMLVSSMMSKGGRASISDAVSAFRDSNVAAFLSRGDTDTGRTAAGEAARARELSGLSGLSGNALAGVGRMLDSSKFVRNAASAEAMDKLRLGIEGFGEMSNARKMDELRSAVTSGMDAITSGRNGYLMNSAEKEAISAMRTGDISRAQALAKSAGTSLEGILDKVDRSGDSAGKSAAAMLRAGLQAQKAGFKGDFITGAIAASKSSMEDANINFEQLFGAAKDNNFLSVKQAQKMADDAYSGLKDAVGSETAQLIKNDPNAKKIVKALMDGDPKVKAALHKGDDSQAAAALAALGYNVKPDDISALKKAHSDITKGGGAVKKAISAFEEADRAGNREVILGAFRDTAAALAQGAKGLTGDQAAMVQKLSESFSAVAGAQTADQYKAAFEKARGGMGDLLELAKNIKDPEARDKLLAAAGPLGQSVQSVLAKDKSLSKLTGRSVTQDQIAKMFGINSTEGYEALARAGITSGGSTKLTSQMVKDVERNVAGLKTAGSMGKAGDAEVAGSKDDTLISTLKSMQKVSELQTTALTAVISGKVTDEQKKAAQEMVSATSEMANAGKNGNTTFH